MRPLEGRNVTLGVSGSIACYKAVDLASKLVQIGAEVDVMMTPAAREFVAPLTFAAITHRPVAESLFDPHSELLIDHVAIAERADVVIVAPATAQTIAKLALGFADDPIGATVLATAAPVIVAPAMDANMYDSPATQANVETLAARGVTIAGPAEGRLASGLMGKGRLLETADLVGYVRLVLGRTGDLAGRKVVVSAGGTQEDIDPVRFVGNRSSGKMGYAIAEAAIDRGAETVIVAAPNVLQAPVGARVVHAGSALEMRGAVLAECANADAVVMAAAVADWRPAERAESKLKKGSQTTLTLELVRTPDIAAEIDGDGLVKIGFAAESDDLIANARAKIAAKGLDLIAANDITADGAGFGSDTNRVTLIDREGKSKELGLMSKYEVGQRILDRVVGMLTRSVLTELTAAFGEPESGSGYWRFKTGKASIYVDTSNSNVGKITKSSLRQGSLPNSSGLESYFQSVEVPLRRPSNPEYQFSPEHVREVIRLIRSGKTD